MLSGLNFGLAICHGLQITYSMLVLRQRKHHAFASASEAQLSIHLPEAPQNIISGHIQFLAKCLCHGISLLSVGMPESFYPGLPPACLSTCRMCQLLSVNSEEEYLLRATLLDTTCIFFSLCTKRKVRALPQMLFGLFVCNLTQHNR